MRFSDRRYLVSVRRYPIKSQNGVVGNYVLGPKILGERGKGPPISDVDILSPMRTHRVGKFGAVPPTDPDDISQSTRDFWPIFEFQALKNCRGQTHPQADPSTMRCALASVGHPLPIAKVLGEKPQPLRYEPPKKSTECPIFRRLWAVVHQIW